MDYCKDRVDKRDYPISKLLGAVTTLPPSILLSNGIVEDQDKKGYEYACVFFSTTDAYNTMNVFDAGSYLSPEDISDKAVSLGLLDRKSGAYVQDGPKLMKKLGRITSYGLCQNIADIKLSLYNKRPVIVGTNTVDWYKTEETGYITEGTSYGHAFSVVGYDDAKEILICENSYGASRYKRGYMFLKYEDFGLLYYSKYTMIDHESIISRYRRMFLS